MNMIEVKTADLIFGALDWSVARVEGLKVELTPANYGYGTALVFLSGEEGLYRPSTDWAQGGPLIEEFMRESGVFCDGLWQHSGAFKCSFEDGGSVSEGDTPLIAAMRAIVTAKLGDTVSVPAELVT